jgi:hypothetical protein
MATTWWYDPVRGVSKEYGVRHTGGALGTDRTTDSKHIISMEIEPEILAPNPTDPWRDSRNTILHLPKGALPISAFVSTDRAWSDSAGAPLEFALRDQANGANNLIVDDTYIFAEGIWDVTANLAGTLDPTGTGVPTDTKLEFDYGGAAITIGEIGHTRMTITYILPSGGA